MKARKPLKRISAKRLKSLGGKVPRSSITGKPTKPRCQCGHVAAKHKDYGHGARCGFWRKRVHEHGATYFPCPCAEYRPVRPRSKRAPLPQRTTPLAKSRTPIKAKGKRRFPKGEDRQHLAKVRASGCYVATRNTQEGQWWGSGCQGHVEATHIISKGAGGGDRNNTIGLCRYHHGQQHSMGIQSWLAMHGITRDALVAEARRLTENP